MILITQHLICCCDSNCFRLKISMISKLFALAKDKRDYIWHILNSTRKSRVCSVAEMFLNSKRQTELKISKITSNSIRNVDGNYLADRKIYIHNRTSCWILTTGWRIENSWTLERDGQIMSV